MPIKLNTILLNAGQYNLRNRTSAPISLQNLRDDAYSLHHVLPYRYPLFVGFLAETYGTNLVAGNLQANWPNSASNDPIAKKVADVHKIVACFGGNQRDLPSQFAWIGPNLFQGPAGNLRIDDPGSSREQVKPWSMGDELWQNLMNLGQRIDHLASLTSDNGYSATIKADVTVQAFESLLNPMELMANRGHGNALTFDAADWICLTSKNVKFQLRPDSIVTTTFKNHFQLHIQNSPKDIIMYKPVVRVRPSVPILWRLRRKDEQEPGIEFLGP